MVNGVVLLVDAVEGPDAADALRHQEALALGLKPISVINKVDRPVASGLVVDQTFDLFDKLAPPTSSSTSDHLPSGLNGWRAWTQDAPCMGGTAADMCRCFDTC